MKKYLLKDYIAILEKEDLIEEVPKALFLDSLQNTMIEKIAHNSKEVTSNTLYICKGLNYKPSYLDEAISNGALLYVAEKQNVTKPDFPHIVVKDIRKSLAAISCMYYDFPAEKINMIGLTGTKRKVNYCLLY